MRSIRWLNLLVVVGLLITLAPSQPAQASPVEPAFTRQGQVDHSAQFVPGEVVVTLGAGLSQGAGAARASALARSVNAQVTASYADMALLSFAAGADVQALADQMVGSGQAVAAQPNYIYWIPEDGSERALQNGTVADQGYTVRIQPGGERTLTRQQLAQMRTVVRSNGRATIRSTFPIEAITSVENTWGWERINTEIVWANRNTSPAVCVVDTGVDGKHKDLRGRVINGYDFVNDDKVAEDDNGHGTHVAGTVTALGNNGATTAIGISNGKVVAVKSLNAQGWGTTFSIAAGVRFCANRTDVRVINLSLGAGEPDAIEYQALKYAIVDRKKVVVAAGGNSYDANLFYPAAWGDPDVTAPGGGANEIAGGLISVAAARINPPTYPVWVDKNHNQYWDAGELYESNDCAVSFTNFGKHINIVAPGHWVYSTTPTSYPFFNQYYYGDRAGYEFYSGTSMAAPFVSAAAARVLSLFPRLSTGTEETVKERLVSSGKPLTYAVDPMTGEAGFDPAHPYDYQEGGAYYFNDGMVKTWESGAETLDAIKAPFCWPDAQGPYTAAEDMSAARYLNVAAAMRRFGTVGEVFDAATALPLKDATVRVIRQDGLVMDTVKVGSQGATVMLMNMPMVTDPNADNVFYFLQVSKPGYTVGYQNYGYVLANFNDDDPLYGEVSMTPTSSVAVPPAREINAVLNWLPYQDANLDLYLWLPEGSATPGYISAGWLEDYRAGYDGAPDLKEGTLLPPGAFGGDVSPYAQLIHDGGGELVAGDILPFDTITIKAKPGTTQPWYSPGAYHLLVTDYSRTYPDTNLELGIYPMKNYLTFPTSSNGYNGDYLAPVLRIWKKGRLAWSDIIQIPYGNGSLSANCEQLSIDWWHAADLQGSTVTPARACGDADEAGAMYILPYPAP